MMKCLRLSQYWWIVLSFIGLLAPAWCEPLVATSYSKPTRTFRVAMLLLHSQRKPGTNKPDGTPVYYWNADPWYLPVINHSPFKPAGWTLENPLASGTLTNDPDLIISGNYYSRDGKGGQKTQSLEGPATPWSSTVGYPTNWYLNSRTVASAIGKPLTKDDPAYWCVKLDAKSLDALASYDLLILNGHSASQLENGDRENIRLLLERGATIMMNNSQRQGAQFNNFFIDPPMFFKADAVNQYKDSNGKWLVKTNPDHWLLNNIYQLNDDEINCLRDNLSYRSFILSGVAGYGFDPFTNTTNTCPNSQVYEVVRLTPADDPWGLGYAPSLAAGRVGSGLIVASGTDLIGGTSDWWENNHVQYPRGGMAGNGYPAFNDLTLWPYTPGMAVTGKKMNDAKSYAACGKLFYNMLARPADWHVVSADANATRSFGQNMSSSLARGWTTPFTTLGEPVSYGNYLAVTGSSALTSTPNELRVYRARRLQGSDGKALDYPLGLYDEAGYQLVPARLVGGQRPAWWQGAGNLRGLWNTGTDYAVSDIVVGVDGSYYQCLATHQAGTSLAPGGVNLNWHNLWVPYTFYPDDALADSEKDLCFSIYLSNNQVGGPSAQWIGAPVFGQLAWTVNGKWVTRTVLYALQAIPNGNSWVFRPRCYPIDPFNSANIQSSTQVGFDQWADLQYPTLNMPNCGIPRASMTFSNGRLVITTFGRSDVYPQHIFMVDGRTGDVRVALGADAQWGGYFRLTGPGSLVTNKMDVEFNANDISPSSLNSVNAAIVPGQSVVVRRTLELLTVTGEYANTRDVGGTPALFLTPPTITVNLAAARASLSRVPPDLCIIEKVPANQLPPFTKTTPASALRHYFFPQPGEVTPRDADKFIRNHTLKITANGSTLKITFDSWDLFFPRGISPNPTLTGPLSISFTPDRFYGTGGGTQVQQQVYLPVQLSMGYPILLRGSQHLPFDPASRLTLHYGDGDGEYSYGYQVDAPPLIYRDQVIVNTNTTGASGFGTLRDSQQIPQPSDQYRGGTLSDYRLAHPGLGYPDLPIGRSSNGDLVWQFFGDTNGPTGMGTGQQTVWRSDFPYPAAVGHNAIFTTGLYNGYGNYDGTVYTPSPATVGMLYAVDPLPTRYLLQVVTAGMVQGYDHTVGNQLTIGASGPGGQNLLTRGPLRSGARALLSVQPDPTLPATWFTWDMGHITRIQGPDQAGRYLVTFDRPGPTDQNGNDLLQGMNFAASPCRLLTTTSVPFLSHVRGWNAKTGAESVRGYTLGADTVVRMSAGAVTAPRRDSANPDARMNSQDIMIAFTGLEFTCHEPDQIDNQLTLWPHDLLPFRGGLDFRPDDWEAAGQVYLPQRPVTQTTNDFTRLPEINYVADPRTGRIELSPGPAGEFADRFVVVHYFTVDLDQGTGVERKMRHAEVMYIPSQVKWKYQFPDAIPDSGPVVINDTVYITANRRVSVNGQAKWQPVLYAFAAQQPRANAVEPAWIQSVGPAVSDDRLPYRCVTSPTPVANGLLVGSAVPGTLADPNPANEIQVFTDRGLLIGDGHRLLRLNADGQVTWQATATKDYDPAALTSGHPNTRTAGVTQKAFTLVTRLRRLSSGNILVCDTGGNRVVELDRNGNTIWQYPDSDVTYMDPDGQLTNNADPNTNNWIPARNAATNPAIGAMRTPTPPLYRLSAPRDVRRYVHDVSWDHLYWRGVDLGAGVIRWETTLIADAGRNRLLEVYRPSVNLAATEVIMGATLYKLSTGFQYRPDLYYVNPVTGKPVFLQQKAVILVDGGALRMNGATFPIPINFTAAMRFRGPDDKLVEVQRTVEQPTLDPAQDSVATRELLVAVGNNVPDPMVKDGFIRTLRISLPGLNNVGIVRNYATLQGAHTAGATVLIVDYNAEFLVGETVTIKSVDGKTTQDLTVQAINTSPAGVRTITVAPGLAQDFVDKSTIIRKQTNALAIRTGTHDYGGILQLDIITLTRNATTGEKENRVLVVDQSGVREVSLYPVQQLVPIFEMVQSPQAVGQTVLDPNTQVSYLDALQHSGWWAVLESTLSDTDRTKLLAWRADTTFAPVAAIRLDAGSGQTTTDPRLVRYLIVQLNSIASTDPATWINGKAQRRIHAFEVRWVNPYQNQGWGIIDSTMNYCVYPNPLATDYPNIPGWTYPLSQPLCIDQD